MGKTIDELRAELAEAQSEVGNAMRAYARIGEWPPSDSIDKRHAGERMYAAIEARDAAETALFAALDAANETPGAAGVVLL